MWEFEWGDQIETLESVVELTGGKMVPLPLINRPKVYLHLLDVIEAVAICESRGNQFSSKVPIAEIAAFFNTFSNFDGSASDFLKLFRHIEDLKAKQRTEKNG